MATLFAANFDESTVENLPITINQGVYYGWAQLQTPGLNQVYKMVTSIGTNPHYNGEKRTMVRLKLTSNENCLSIMLFFT